MRPELVHLFGPITIRSYGTMLALAFLAGGLLIAREAKRQNLNPSLALDLVFWLLLGGLLGARTLAVLLNLDYYFSPRTSIWEIFMIQRGGLVFYGGFIGATIVGLIYVRVKKLPAFRVLDIAAPAVALGGAITRIGCFLNGCCWGAVTHVPWGVRFPKFIDKQGHMIASYAFRDHLDKGLVQASDRFSLPVHPTQLYESIGFLLIFAALMLLRRKKKYEGQLFVYFVMFYSVLRFNVELFRGDNPHVLFGLTPSQIISVVLFAVSLIIYMVKYRSLWQTEEKDSHRRSGAGATVGRSRT